MGSGKTMLACKVAPDCEVVDMSQRLGVTGYTLQVCVHSSANTSSRSDYVANADVQGEEANDIAKKQINILLEPVQVDSHQIQNHPASSSFDARFVILYFQTHESVATKSGREFGKPT